MPRDGAKSGKGSKSSKTARVLSLLGALRQRHFRTLGVDLDPQGSLGFSTGLDIENCPTI